MSVKYADLTKMTCWKFHRAPRKGQTVSGYGGAIPTGIMVKYNGRWHQVKVMIYGNSGSAYIVSKGEILHIDDTALDIVPKLH